MPVLSGAQQITGAPDLEIPHGDLKPGTKFCKLLDRGKTLFGNFF